MGQFAGKIEGYIYDKSLKAPLEYANIVVFNLRDSSQVNGTITNSEGYFSLDINRPGVYYIRFGFIGYKDLFKDTVVMNLDRKFVEFKEVYLEPQAYDLDEVVVEAEGAPITYHIDKKVINVSQQITSLSGTAVNVLENVPSVTVDIEGNVSLRGSGSFQVLIDGRPTILSSNEALQQIPASSIENIEIITNPSAKYNPEGTAGIINVILKKNSLLGLSSILEMNVGFNNRYGGETIFDYKMDGAQLNLGLDYNKRFFEMTSVTESRNDFQGTSTFLNSEGAAERGRTSYGIRGSFSLDFNDHNNLLFGARYGDRDGQMNGSSYYSKSSSGANTIQNYINSSYRNRGGNFYELNLNYIHKLNKSGHELTGELGYEHSDGDENNINTLTENDIVTSGQKSIESGPDNEFRIKLDYVLPMGEESKFEAGYQTEMELTEEFNDVFIYDVNLGDFLYKDEYSNKTRYGDNVHSLYSLYAGSTGPLKYQVGLRGELTDREIELLNTGENFVINEFDVFPTLHISSKLAPNHQVMASYTRRIQRPHGWELEPFLTWIDAYNVRIGNPSLEPEYFNSFELGYQLMFGKSILSLETYYRENYNRIERIRSVYDEDITLTTTQNVGKSYSIGAETMANFDPITDWNVNLMSDFYNYKIDGSYFEQNFSKQDFSWSVRFNNNIKVTSSTQFQINAQYNSPVVSAQSERKEFFSINAALRQEFFDKQLALTLQVRDLFKTTKFESITQTPELYQYSYADPEAPIVMLNARFNFNNYKKQDRGENQNGANGMEDDF